jgi:hypothetical protein
MQLSAISQIDGNPSMVVDYYPVKVSLDADVSPDYMLKIVSFKGTDTMSKKVISKKDFTRECEERINMGYQVTDFHTLPQLANPMWGAC